MPDVPTSKEKFRILSKTDANIKLGTYQVGRYFIPYIFITAINNNI